MGKSKNAVVRTETIRRIVRVEGKMWGKGFPSTVPVPEKMNKLATKCREKSRNVFTIIFS